MADNWKIDGLINNLPSLQKDYDDFIENLLGACWDLRASKKNESAKALKVLYDIQCGYHVFKSESASIIEVFNNFFEDIARCGRGFSDRLHYDPIKYLIQSEKDRFNSVLVQCEAEQKKELKASERWAKVLKEISPIGKQPDEVPLKEKMAEKGVTEVQQGWHEVLVEKEVTDEATRKAVAAASTGDLLTKHLNKIAKFASRANKAVLQSASKGRE